MNFRLFSATPLKILGQSLAADIACRYPAAIANSPQPPVSPQRRAEILENIFLRSRQFSLENRLGILGRIRLESALRWRLKEMGYDEAFIDMARDYLLASIAQKAK